MPDDGKISGLYDRDFYEWSGQQARAIRAARVALSDSRVNDIRASLTEMDWENIAEEIESLGKRDRRELQNRIATVIEHLIKLQLSPADEPREGWRDTVRRSRDEIEMLLDDSPSLRPMVPGLANKATRNALRYAIDGLRNHAEIDGAASAIPAEYTQDQILNDWWPEART